MSSQQAGNGQASTSTWTEPPWSGWIETTGDALLILEAARRGLIPRVTRRLVDSERKMITSGSVFVFDEDESGIKRWTDGFFWSPSRILGNFLLYRETDKRGAGHRGSRTDQSGPSDVNETSQYNVDGVKLEGQTLSRPKSELNAVGLDKHRERSLVGSLTNSYKFKPDGLMKKTFSLTIGGVSQHLISYYRIEDVEQGRLRPPSSLPELASLDISPEYLDKTHFRNPPKVEIGVDGIPRYRGEADDIETSPHTITAPLSTGMPLLTDGRTSDGSSSGVKRNKRFDPYGGGNAGSSKRARKSKNPETPTPTNDEVPSAPGSPQPTAYPDTGVAVVHAPYPPYGMPPSYYPGYPVPHLYPPGPYPPPPGPPTSGTPSPANSQSPVSTTQSPTVPPPQPYVYPPFAVPAGGADPSQAVTPAQQGYYPYYPPHAHYPGYGGVAWPPYPGYPPPPGSAPQSATANALPAAASAAADTKIEQDARVEQAVGIGSEST